MPSATLIRQYGVRARLPEALRHDCCWTPHLVQATAVRRPIVCLALAHGETGPHLETRGPWACEREMKKMVYVR
jgi:hypothetical protein